MLVRNEKYRAEYAFQSWLCRVHIMNKKPQLAWELYLRMETSNESFAMLQLIANDAYSTGAFYFAAKAFGTPTPARLVAPGLSAVLSIHSVCARERRCAGAARPEP